MTEPFDLTRLLKDRPSVRTSSGLHVVLDELPALGTGPGPWTESPLGLAFPSQPEPTFLGQIVVTPSQGDLEFETLTDDQIRELIAPIPLALGLIWSARRTRRVWNSDFTFEGQMEVFEFVVSDNPPLIDKYRTFLVESDSGEMRAAFSDQQFHILTRFAMESCSTSAPIEWTDAYEAAMRRALIAVTNVTEREAARLTEGAREPKDWLRYFTQTGAYHSKEQQLLAYQRIWRVFVELPETEAARAHDDFTDFEGLSLSSQGATVREAFAVGFGAARNALTFDPAVPTNESIASAFEEYLSTTVLASRHQTFTDLLSDTQSFYVDMFQRSRDSETRMATDITPFQQKPFYRLPDGALVLLSPRAMESWLTEGVYYRLLDAAAAVGERDKFTAFVGWLYEKYVVELFEAALPGASPGNGRVHPDIVYGGSKTSDVTIDYGKDIILVEVISTMLPLGVRSEADEEVLETFLDRAVLDKLVQLDRVIDDLQNGSARIPEVVMGQVDRIWPVLVTIGDVTEGEPLFSYINENAPELLGQAQAQPLTILGIDDAEALAGLASSGENLVQILEAKIEDGFAQLGLDRWFHDRRTGNPPRLPLLEERWARMSDELLRVLTGGDPS